MIPSTTIQTVIREMYLDQTSKPTDEVIHMYFETEDEARTYSFRTGKPFFFSCINGVKLFSVKVK